MKNCSSYKKQLLHHLRGDLAETEEKALTEHLSNCAACRKELEEFRAVFLYTGVEERITGPDAERVLSSTLQAIREEGSRKAARSPGQRRHLTRLSAAAAALLLVSVGVITAVKLFGPSTVEPRLKPKKYEGAALELPRFDLPELALLDMDPGIHPEKSDKVHWENDFDDIRSLASYSSCPILLEVYAECCPIAECVNNECLTDESVVNATRDYLCIRRTLEDHEREDHEIEATPEFSPAFFILSPDGKVMRQFGGRITREALLEELSSNAESADWISFRKFQKYRSLLDEAAKAYNRKSFCRAQEFIDCFNQECATCCCCIKGKGLTNEFKKILRSMQKYIASKHEFARALVANREVARAIDFYRELLEEFSGLPITSIIREELTEISKLNN